MKRPLMAYWKMITQTGIVYNVQITTTATTAAKTFLDWTKVGIGADHKKRQNIFLFRKEFSSENSWVEYLAKSNLIDRYEIEEV